MEGEESPFENILIIESFMKYLPSEDLKSTRLVSPLWKSIANGILRKRIKPCKVKGQNLIKFLELLKSSNDFPHKSIDLRLSRIGLETNLWRGFECFRFIGKHFTSLRIDLSCCQLPTFFLLLPYFINLQTLSISIYFTIHQQCPHLSSYCYLILPHLTSLEISCRPSKHSFKIYLFSNLLQIDKILEKIIEASPRLLSLTFINWKTSLSRLLRCSSISPTLKCLNFKGFTINDQETLHLASKCKNLPKLESLSISFHSNTRKESISSLLRALSGNLTHLEIECDTNFEDFLFPEKTIKGESMKKLKRLMINGEEVHYTIMK